MLQKALVEEQEELIRQQVRSLSEEQRQKFYHLLEPRMKDPDTYATLNYIFIAGLHHFYLGHWVLGLINIGIFWAGVILLYQGAVLIGAGLIVGITIYELYELVRSQTLVKHYNNQIMSKLYHEVVGTPIHKALESKP